MESGCEFTLKKQMLIEDNMNLVYSLITKEYPTYIHDEDIIQCGMLGLCKAADKWDESKSQFSTYAWYCIRNEILQEFRRRMKHQGVLSLDYETNDEDGGRSTFGDCVVGDEDVPYIDANIDGITERERQIFDLYKTGLSQVDVATKLGVTKQYVWRVMRKIRTLWDLNDRKG